MPRATVTSKGQITIPVEIRREMGLEEGAQVEFIVNAQHRIELIPRNRDLRALRGSIRPLHAVSTEAMREVTAKQWAARVPAGEQPQSPPTGGEAPSGAAGKYGQA